MKFSLCIPMYNEVSIIRDTARQLSDYMAANFEDYEIIFINDGSSDGCDKAVSEMNLPRVRVEGYAENRGKGYAVRLGMLCAKGDVRMFTDADLAYGLDVIAQTRDEFIKAPDVDMVIGSRNLTADGYEGYTFIRKLASKIYIKVLSFIGGFKLTDSQCGCKAFRGETAKKIFSMCEVDRFAFDFEAILWANKFSLKIIEMPVKIINHRESKVNVLHDAPRMIRDIIKMKRKIKKIDI